MEVKFFQKQIIELRKAVGNPNAITNEEANSLWKSFMNVDAFSVARAIKELIEKKKVSYHDLKYKLEQCVPKTTNVVNETTIAVPEPEDKESPQEELGFKKFDKPLGEISKAGSEHIHTPKPRSNYCCNYGTVLARKKDNGYVYAFRCSCGFGQTKSYALWEGQLEYEKL